MKSIKKPTIANMIFVLWQPYKRLVLITFVLLLGFAFMESISIALLYTVFSQTMQAVAKSDAPDKIYSYILEVAKYVPIKDMFVLSCVLLIISYFLKSIFSFLSKFTGFYLLSSITKRDFHDRIFRKFLNSEYSFFIKQKHGWLMHRTMTIPAEASMLLDYIPRVMVNVLKILAIITMLFFISPLVTIFVVILGVVYYFITKAVAKKVSYYIGKDKVNELQSQNEMVSEAFTGIKQLKVFSAVNAWIQRFRKSIFKYSKLEIRDGIWVITPPCVMEFVVIGVLMVVLMMMKIYNEAGFLTILSVIAIFGYALQRIIPALNLVGTQMTSFSSKLPTLEIIYDIFTNSHKPRDGDLDLKEFNHNISFKNVSFAYPSRDILFRNLSFDIKKGTTVAIVGPSGSGKSTIVDLMLRLFMVKDGSILIDNNDLKDIKINSWLLKVGLVSQDTFIFHGTIKENISFGLKVCDEDSIEKVAKIANAHDFISKFPDGYDTVVGDRGAKISVGQRQRIAIARALLRDPEVLILDEATSSLDSISESLVQESINNISKNHTVIMVAHRLSTIIDAEKIIVLNESRIEEEGNHKELMNKKGLYWRLYNMQKQDTDYGETM